MVVADLDDGVGTIGFARELESTIVLVEGDVLSILGVEALSMSQLWPSVAPRGLPKR